LTTPADRWIFSRLAAVIDEVAGLYDTYDFAESARVLYRFVWNEICDWYLEVAKSRLYAEEEAARLAVSGNLLVLLERVMGLLHPMMPFVTEEIYRNLPQVRAGDGAASLFATAWPVADPAWPDAAAERAMESFVAIVSGLRSAREELDVPRGTRGSLHLVTADAAVGRDLVQQAASLTQLTGCELSGVVATVTELPAGRFASVEAGAATAYLLLEGFVDVERERQRLLTKAGKARDEAAKARRKLDNAGFVAKAPPEVIQEERDRLARGEAVLAEIGRQYHERIGEDLPSE
jgi:valyl-tRNA synthetase